MRKGIVMEKRRRYMIVMTRNGIFQKAAPMDNSAIGEEVYFKPIASRKWLSFFFYPKKNRRTPVRLIAMVCMLLVIAMPFYFIVDKDKAFAYVNIDINPSLELKIDDTLRVYEVTPLNEDANKIVKKLKHYKNEDVEKVIGMIMNHSEEAGLINKGKNMLVGVSFIDEESQGSDLINRLRRHLSRDKSSWEIVAFQVPEKIREKAQQKNKTMNETMATEIIDGKENAVNKEEKAIIESFYHTKDNQKQQERPDNPDKKENENIDTSKKQPEKQDNIEQDTTASKQKNKANKQGQNKQKENNSENNAAEKNKEKKQQPDKKDINEKKNKDVKHGNHKHTYKNKEKNKKERHKKHNEKRESKHHHKQEQINKNKHKPKPKHHHKHNQNKHNKHNNGRSHH